jgi:hypothetical protein
MHATFVMPYSAGGVLCFARIKSAFEMNNVQRGDVTLLLRPLWRAKLQFARHRLQFWICRRYFSGSYPGARVINEPAIDEIA